jgi:two-component system nitrate/nitrite response regulator NarL
MTQGHLIIAGENHLFREGLKHVLGSANYTIVGEVASLRELPPMLRSTDQSANLVVYDQPENSIQEFDALKEITGEFPQVGIVILADHIDPAGLDMALGGGARGFLPKNISSAALNLSLELILLGENLFTAPASLSVGRSMIQRPPVAGEVFGNRAPLSLRERQILDCLETGLPNKTIARNLDIAEATVKVHLKAVLRKINVSNRTQAAVWAMNHRSPTQAM